MHSLLSFLSRASILHLALFLFLLPLRLALAKDASEAGFYLQPIHWDDYQAAYTGIRRRDIDSTAYKLRDEARFIYGKLSGNSCSLVILATNGPMDDY
jgi:hypothetical protein